MIKKWLAGALLGAGLALCAMAQTAPDLSRIVPAAAGKLEAEMWRAYYEGRWIDLIARTADFSYSQYGVPPLEAAAMAGHGGRAAMFFRTDTEDPRCMPELEAFFTLVSKASGRDFDAKKAAELELRWWRERRRNLGPDVYGETMASVMAHVGGGERARFVEGAKLRARAMAYRDARRDGKMGEDDWREVARQLSAAYESLRGALADE